MIQRPTPDEYKPYFARYIDRVPEGDFGALLAQNTAETLAFFAAIPAEKHGYRYAEGKWSVRDVLMHLIDTERLFGYRAMVAARCDDSVVLPGMDEDHYAAHAGGDARHMDDLLAEFGAVRSATEHFFAHLGGPQSSFRANANGAPMSARAAGYAIIGHVLHHRAVLEERYL